MITRDRRQRVRECRRLHCDEIPGIHEQLADKVQALHGTSGDHQLVWGDHHVSAPQLGQKTRAQLLISLGGTVIERGRLILCQDGGHDFAELLTGQPIGPWAAGTEGDDVLPSLTPTLGEDAHDLINEL